MPLLRSAFVFFTFNTTKWNFDMLMWLTALEDIYIYIVGDIYRYIVRNIFRCILGDIYRYILGDIYRYIVGDIYRYMLGYIYRHMGGYLHIQVIAESRYRNQRLFLWCLVELPHNNLQFWWILIIPLHWTYYCFSAQLNQHLQ